jgi:hypothetical protein
MSDVILYLAQKAKNKSQNQWHKQYKSYCE